MANHISHASLPFPIKNARFTLLVPYLDADGDPTDPTTPDTEVSQDGGAFADAAEEMTTISGSNGLGYITLSGAETNNSAVGVACKVASGPKATLATLYPRNLPILESGTASAGAAGTITLASGTYTGLNLAGCFLRTTGGTGGGGTGGANNQARRITSYNTSTRVATVTPNWETTPDGTTTYDILLPEGILVPMLTALAPTTLARTLDVSSGGEAGLDWANVGSPTTTVNLSGTSTKALEPATAGRTLVVDAAGLADANVVKIGPTGSGTAQTAGDIYGAVNTRLPAALVSGRIDASVGAMAANVLTASAIQDDAITSAKLAADCIGASELAAGAVAEIAAAILATPSQLLVTDASGRVTVGSLAAGSITSAVIATDAIDADAVASDLYIELRAALGLASNNLDTQLAAIAGYIDTEVAAILAAVDTEVAAIKAKTDNLPAAPAATGDIPTAAQNAAGLLDLAAGVETNRTVRQTLRLMLAALVGKLSGAATTTVTIRDTNDGVNRVVATVDADGNRSAVTLDAS